MPIRLSDLVAAIGREVEAARLRLALARHGMARDLRAHGLDPGPALPGVQIARATFDLHLAVAEAREPEAGIPADTAAFAARLRRVVAELPEKETVRELFAEAPRLAGLWKREAPEAVATLAGELPAGLPADLAARLAGLAARAVWSALVADVRAGLRLRDVRRLAAPGVAARVARAVEDAIGREEPAPAAAGAPAVRVLVTAEELREAGAVGTLHLEIEEDGPEAWALAAREPSEEER